MDYLPFIQILLDGHTFAEITASMDCSRSNISTAKKATGVHQITAGNLDSITQM